jgi:hypothetical protein
MQILLCLQNNVCTTQFFEIYIYIKQLFNFFIYSGYRGKSKVGKKKNGINGLFSKKKKKSQVSFEKQHTKYKVEIHTSQFK